MPLSNTTRNIEPIKVPSIEPAPPKRLTPPIMQAAMTRSSIPTPKVGRAEENLEVKNIPTMHARTPIRTYKENVSFFVLIPASLVLCGLPPIARVYLPYLVFLSTKVATINKKIINQITYATPNNEPSPIILKLSGIGEIGVPFVIPSRIPL